MPDGAEKVSVKLVGANGQISLGKKYAGRHMLVEEQAPGVWLVRTASVIPDSEAWLHAPKARRDLAAALDWAEEHPASAAETDAVLDRLDRG